jgi:hypothetical protein
LGNEAKSRFRFIPQFRTSDYHYTVATNGPVRWLRLQTRYTLSERKQPRVDPGSCVLQVRASVRVLPIKEEKMRLVAEPRLTLSP